MPINLGHRRLKAVPNNKAPDSTSTTERERRSRLRGGWFRLDHQHMLSAYWLDPYPLADADTPQDRSHGGRTSPIYDVVSGMHGSTEQWINLDTGAAVILRVDGNWRTGGHWHVWHSPAPGALPVDLTGALDELEEARIRPGENDAWIERTSEAVNIVEGALLAA